MACSWKALILYSVTAGDAKWCQPPILPSLKGWSRWWYGLPPSAKWSSGCSGSWLDFPQELKKGWCQWCGEKTSCEGWWRQWKLSSLEFNQVLFVWKPEKNLSVCVALPGLSCRGPLGTGASPWMRWIHVEFGGFVLCNPSWFCFKYTQERETHGWPLRKVGLDKNCFLFLKNAETRNLTKPPGKW